MYNRDNEYGPGNPKPICAAGSGGVQGDCPENSYHLILADPNITTMRTTGSKTFTYEDVFVEDMNWEGERRVERIQINGYFQIDDGPVSLPNSNCVTYTSAGQALACVDLTSSNSAPTLGDTVALTCEAKFSAVNRVAFFRHNVDGGTYTESAAVNINSTTNTATYNLTLDQTGSWNTQCRVCTSAAATSCTTWGQAQ